MRMKRSFGKGRAAGIALFLCVLRGNWRRLGSCGSVFQTGLPLWARNRGSKDPRLLRDRPSDGAALVRKNLCGFEEVKYDENARFFGRMGPQRRTWNAGFLTVLYVNHAVFLR